MPSQELYLSTNLKSDIVLNSGLSFFFFGPIPTSTLLHLGGNYCTLTLCNYQENISYLNSSITVEVNPHVKKKIIV